jgi:glutamine synthetase
VAGFDRLTKNDVEFEIEKKAVDTVLLAFADPQGRLVATRLTADFFLKEVLAAGLRVPPHLLATDASGAADPAFDVLSAERGYGDLVLRPDPATWFRVPWQPATVGILADVEHADGTIAAVSPRAVLRRQAQRLEAAGYAATVVSEPQFTLASADTTLTGNHLSSRSAAVEPLMHRIRRSLVEMPVATQGITGLLGAGHFEVTLRPEDLLPACDGALLARAAVKEIAAQEGIVATFMAAYDESVGSGGHISVSLRGQRGGTPLADRSNETGLALVGRAFVAGLLAHANELCVLYAPTVNSYRRFGSDPYSPTVLTWGQDDRTCAIRLVGTDATLRVENRIPGSDASAYLTAAATIASGLDGITRQLVLPPARSTDAEPLPASLADALTAWTASTWVRETFGPEVQDHYATMARIEIEAGITTPGLEWERSRYVDAC